MNALDNIISNSNLFSDPNLAEGVQATRETTLETPKKIKETTVWIAACANFLRSRMAECSGSATLYVTMLPSYASPLIESIESRISQVLYINKTYQPAIQSALIVGHNMYNGSVYGARTREADDLERRIQQIEQTPESEHTQSQEEVLLELRLTLAKKQLWIRAAKMMAAIQIPCLLLPLFSLAPKNNSYHQIGQLISKLLLVLWQCNWVHQEIATVAQIMPSVLTETVHMAALVNELSNDPSRPDQRASHARLLSNCVSSFWIAYMLIFLLIGFVSRIAQRFQ